MPLILPNTIANAQNADGDKLQQNYVAIRDWINQETINRDGSTAMTGPLLLPGAPTQTNQAATKGYVDSSTPVGVIQMFSGDTEPAQWMFCRGQVISRATYAALFAVVGSRFGAGDGVTTFKLPDMRGQYPVGNGQGSGGIFAAGVGEKGGTKDAVVVAHTHPGEGGGQYLLQRGDAVVSFSFGPGYGFVSAPSTSSAGVTGTNANLPPSTSLNFIIRVS